MNINKILYLGAIIAISACGGSAEHKHNDSAAAKSEEGKEHHMEAKANANGFYGTEFEITNAMTMDEAIKKAADKNAPKEFVVKGEVSKVCKKEGCWFKIKTAAGDQFIDFDHNFVIPKEESTVGKIAIAKGYFYNDTTTVEKLKHLAEDEGKSAEEIAKITQPEIEKNFRATGVKLEDKK